MKRENAGGFRLFSYRQGDRSEYLAIYALTRIAFVTPVPRQEDFGILDFRCVLAKREGNECHPKGTFNVQVKSEDVNLRLSSGQIRWISTNMDCPLFICVVDKKGTTIKFYSCLNVWSALFLRMHPQSITLFLGKNGPNSKPYVHHPGNTGNTATDIEGDFDVFLGPPVIDMSLIEFEKDADKVFEILHAWIKLDRFNVALMRFGRAATLTFEATKPNEVPTEARLQKVFNREVNQHGLLDKICPLLDSLQQSYKRFGRPKRALQVAKLLDSFRRDIAGSLGNALDRLLE